MMIRRLKKALGWKDRVEELMESPPIGNISSQIMTLYFGGDIQDLKDRMLVRPQAKKFAEERCLESICKVLRIAFEYDRIVIVRPSELFDGIFSRFSNWVECDSHGNPSFKNKDYDSLIHLEVIVKCVANHESGIRIIGFSKGCVVLNQFLMEMSSRPPDSFTSKIKSMVWLDGGHGGKKNTWITDEGVLKGFRKNYPDIDLEVRVTPYQVNDKNKPWVGHEEEVFSNTLSTFGFFKRQLYFENDTSLDAHFNIINTLVDEKPE